MFPTQLLGGNLGSIATAKALQLAKQNKKAPTGPSKDLTHNASLFTGFAGCERGVEGVEKEGWVVFTWLGLLS